MLISAPKKGDLSRGATAVRQAVSYRSSRRCVAALLSGKGRGGHYAAHSNSEFYEEIQMNSITFDGFPLILKNGVELVVLIVCRISTAHQDPRSLADQAALCEQHVRTRYSGQIRFTRIQVQCSGEFL